MRTFFDQAAQKELKERLTKLTPQTQAQWGKMNTAQMLAHCSCTLRVPVGDLKVKPIFLRHIGRFFKSLAVNDKPFSKNSPTAAEFLIKDDRNFDVEKKNFMAAFNKLAAGGEQGVTASEHAFFGPMTPSEWGFLMYKHVDHHFQQFGV